MGYHCGIATLLTPHSTTMCLFCFPFRYNGNIFLDVVSMDMVQSNPSRGNVAIEVARLHHQYDLLDADYNIEQ